MVNERDYAKQPEPRRSLQPDELVADSWYTIRLKEAAEPTQRGQFVRLESRRGQPLVMVFRLSGNREKHFAVNGVARIE